MNLPQQFLNDLFTFSVSTLAEVSVPQIPVFIEKIFGWPVAIGKCLPDLAVAVDHDWIGQPKFADAASNIRFILCEGELRRVYANDGQTLFPIALMPGLYVGQRADAVDAGVVPEIDQH